MNVKKQDVLARLESVSFGTRYYQLVEERRGAAAAALDLGAALARLPVSFRYRSREKFWQHLEQDPAPSPFTFGLHVAEARGRVEFILVVKDDEGHHGGPFAGLARDLGERAGRPLPVEGYPKVTAKDQQALEEIVGEGYTLFRDAVQALRGSAP